MLFSKFSQYLLKTEQTPSRLGMTSQLSELFSLLNKEEIPFAIYLSLGRLVPEYKSLEFQLSAKMVLRVLVQEMAQNPDIYGEGLPISNLFDETTDDLYEKKREKDVEQLKTFSKMLKRIHARIQTTSRQRTGEKLCWFTVPEIMLGIPSYDQGMCIAFIMDKLKTNGFRVQYFHPNTLMITWQHWVPNYVIQEIKEKTGRVYDNQGNDLTPKPDVDYETNNL